MEKEFLYVGYYYDTENRFILKIGTTKDLVERQKQHTRNYRKSPKYTLPVDRQFHYLWHLPLSKYNTLRFEDRNRANWQTMGIGEFVRNDRFYCEKIPEFVEIAIKKTYTIPVAACV